MTVLKWLIFWPVATNVMLVVTAVVLSLPLATVIGLAFVVELAVFAAYVMTAGLRYLARPRTQRQEYRRRWQPEPWLEGYVIRDVGVMPNVTW